VFTAQELMMIFDALAQYRIRPEFVDSETLDAWFDQVGTKIEVELGKMGYTFEGSVEYHVATH